MFVVTPPITDQFVPPFVEFSQMYVIVPEPVPSVEVIFAGAVLLQIVCEAAIEPAVTVACTVTVIAVVADEVHEVEPTVDTVVLRYNVVVVRDPG